MSYNNNNSDMELEEGEALSYYNNNNNDIDPDVALSYLDEKVQFVLGHFQKDFEGGCSAENLGSKYGGYGSFLPTYQRSPAVWSHPKTPTKAQGYNIPQSPNNLHLEASHQNTILSSGTARFSRSPLVDSALSKRDNHFELTSKQQSINKIVCSTDQKTLKVRIKVGSENMAQTNAEIYGGLGLDFSPTSSMEDSPLDSGALSPKSRDAQSPTSILQVMMSDPVPGGLLLSPLPDDLVYFCETESPIGDRRTGLAYKSSQESTAVLVDQSLSLRKEEEVTREKKNKLVEKAGRSSVNEASSLFRKDIDTEISSSREATAVKIPLISNMKSSVFEASEATDRVSDVSRKVKKGKAADDFSSSNPVKERKLTNSSDKQLKDMKAPSHEDGLSIHKRNGKNSSEKKHGLFTFDSNRVKVAKDVDGGAEDSSDKKDDGKSRSQLQDVAETSNKQQQMLGGKSRNKVNRSNLVTELDNGNLRVSSSAGLKDKRKSSGDYPCKANNNSKESSKARGIRRDAHMDVKVEETESWMGTPLKDMSKISNKLEGVEKVTQKFADKSKESLNCRKAHDSSISEDYLKADQNTAPTARIVPSRDVIFPTETPLVIKEDWVECDRCKKWRLLPFGTNPDTLPKKWLCSMIHWLPGMNSCTFSEDETTKALYALFNLPVPEPQNDQHTQQNHPAEATYPADLNRMPSKGKKKYESKLFNLPVLEPQNDQHTQQNHTDEATYPADLNCIPSKGKKKYESKETSNVVIRMGSTNNGNSTKKNQQTSIKNCSLNGVKEIPFESVTGNKSGLPSLTKSNDTVPAKSRRRQKEDHNVPDGGDAKRIAVKTKRDPDQDDLRAFKKFKIEGAYCEDEDHGGIQGKFGKSLAVSGNKYKRENPVSLEGSASDIEKYDQMFTLAKKNRGTELKELPSSGHHYEVNTVYLKEESSESDFRRRKKAKISKSEGKDFDSRTDERVKDTRILISGSRDKIGNGIESDRGYMEKEVGHSQTGKSMPPNMLDIDLSKRDLRYEELPVAAASSSSKISGSRKSKFDVQEVKGSPVESVSSSPSRYLNSGNGKSARRISFSNNEVTNVDFSVMGSEKRCLDGEELGGSDRHFSGTNKKEPDSSVLHTGLLESTEPDNKKLDNCKSQFGKAKLHNKPSHSELEEPYIINGESRGVDDHGMGNQDREIRECNRETYKLSSDLYHSNGPVSRKSGEDLSTRFKERRRISKFDIKGDIKENKPLTEQNELYETKFRGRSPFLDDTYNTNNINAKSHTDERKYFGRREQQGKSGCAEGLDAKIKATCGNDEKLNTQHDEPQDHDRNRSLNHFPLDTSDRGKSQVPSDSGDKQEGRTRVPRPIPVEGDSNSAIVKKHTRKLENQYEPYNNLRHSMPNSISTDIDAPILLKKDSSGPAALKEAKDLKHTADRMKNSGLGLESTGLYFQAALKFLHGASLLESSNAETVKNGETQSMQVYSDTAKLCMFVAHEYERCKEMASAALAYKCMEVAYMRVVYSKHSAINKDRAVLEMIPPGESSSSSASDVDNLNTQGVQDKLTSMKGVNSLNVGGNHVIAAKNRPHFTRLLNFTQDVNSAMEASRKSQNAFASASGEDISSVKRVLDFSFHDVQGLLRLVRLAVDTLTH